MRLAVLAAMIFAFLPSRGMSCSCIGPTDALSAAKGAKVVFVGKTLATEVVVLSEDSEVFRPAGARADGSIVRYTTFRVETLFKGKVHPVVTLITGVGGGDCGFAFKQGEEYLVFADSPSWGNIAAVASKNDLTTQLCSFTQPVAGSGEAVKDLRKRYSARQPTFVTWPTEPTASPN